jgi:hypothetical protein
MAPIETLLKLRARRAYELGRLRWSLRFAPGVIAAAAAAVAAGRPAPVSCAFAAVLLPLVVALAYAGGSVGRAVIPGLESGAAALAMPLLVGTLGRACFGPACMFLCLPACVVGGALAGAFIARRAAREEREPGFVLAALAVAGLTGAMGCTMAGLAGVGGMLAGVVLGGAPVLIANRAR